MKKIRQKDPEKVWRTFKESEKLTDSQLSLFTKYEALLSEQSRFIPLTAVKGVSAIVRQHFVDSMVLRKFINLSTISSIADVGAGAGFPSLPLKIIFPHIRVLLIEVNKKKQRFLKDLIAHLGLEDVELCSLDWRTFLRTTEGKIDLFVSRATFGDEELCRLFRFNSAYRSASLVYWVSELWEPEKKSLRYLVERYEYKLGKRKRFLTLWHLREKALEQKL